MKGSKRGKSSADKHRAIRLIRVSTLAQSAEDAYGIPSQRQACEEVARKNNLEVPEEWQFEIKDVSGANVRRSPKMVRLLEIVKSGQAAGVIMSEQSRLMRDNDSEVLRLLQESGSRLFLPEGVIDLSDPSQALIGEIKFSFSKYERTVIRNRMYNGKCAKRRQGKWASGVHSVPFALKLGDDHRLYADKDLIKIVKFIFATFIAGGGFTSFGSLADKAEREFGAEGKLTAARIKYILESEIYAGYHVPKKIARTDREAQITDLDGCLKYQLRAVIPVEERERIKMLENPPISEHDFNQVQALIAFRQSLRIRLRDSVEDPFSYRGFLVCAECGRRLITVSYTNRNANNWYAEYYVCIGAHGSRKSTNKTYYIPPRTCPTRRIRREVLETLLDSKIAEKMGDENLIRKVMEAQAKAASKAGDIEERMKHLEELIKKAEAGKEDNEWLLRRGSITKSEFIAAETILQAEINVSRTAFANLRPKSLVITPEIWRSFANKFRHWHDYDQRTRRALLAASGASFEVAGYPGERYHETIVAVKQVRLRLGGNNKEGEQAASEEIVENLDDGSRSRSVDCQSLLHSASVNNQYSMSLPL